MTYTIVFSDEARTRLLQLPASIIGILPDHFARLAARPVTLSMPGDPQASLPNRQIYAFPANFPDGGQFQDETTRYVINVTAISHSGPAMP